MKAPRHIIMCMYTWLVAMGITVNIVTLRSIRAAAGVQPAHQAVCLAVRSKGAFGP